MTLGDSGYCLGGYNAKSIDKSSLGIILIDWFLFSQWLPISDVCRVSVGCLEGVWKCLEGVQGCLITLQGVTMLFQPINMDRESCYSSSCFSPSAIFSARIPFFSPKSPDFEMAVPGGFLEDRAWVLWNFSPIFGHLTLFRWLKFEILTLVIYGTPYRQSLKTSAVLNASLMPFY